MASGPASPTPSPDALQPKLIEGLQTVHAIKSAGLRMFATMLPAVRRQRDDPAMSEVHDLLERMANAFGGHEQTTREHERRLRARLTELGAAPSRPRELGLGAAALLRGHLGRIGGQNHGANARDAFVFEHLEIATWELLEQLAERLGDRATADLARTCRADDDEMAALVRRNFTNVLSLMLASEGLPPFRDGEGQGGGTGGGSDG
jgi:ferritin-like metal-binding protein YciE